MSNIPIHKQQFLQNKCCIHLFVAIFYYFILWLIVFEKITNELYHIIIQLFCILFDIFSLLRILP